jgi:hypothetical protein
MWKRACDAGGASVLIESRDLPVMGSESFAQLSLFVIGFTFRPRDLSAPIREQLELFLMHVLLIELVTGLFS